MIFLWTMANPNNFCGTSLEDREWWSTRPAMSFWEKIFGKASLSPREAAWESIKQEARESEQLRRRSLEQSPRATPKEMAAHIANLRSFDQLIRAYNDMRHADFCDAVTAAVRAGNFSDQDASSALYAREWVSSGGAWRTTLPEWIEGEGRQHFLRLNNEWLRSGEKYTPFNDWLVGIVRSKAEPVLPKAAQTIAQETGARTGGNEQNGGEPPVQGGKWLIDGDKLVCNFELTGLPPPQTTTSLRIECAVSRWDNGVLATYLDFYLTPYLYLIPDHEPFEPHLVKAPFALGLVADGSGRGTEASPLIEGGMFEVNASGNGEAIPDTAILRIVSSRDTALATGTLALGKNLTLTLIDYETEPPVKLRLRLKGDPNFSQLYERLRGTV